MSSSRDVKITTLHEAHVSRCYGSLVCIEVVQRNQTPTCRLLSVKFPLDVLIEGIDLKALGLLFHQPPEFGQIQHDPF